MVQSASGFKGERAADLRAAQTVSEASPKTVSYRAASTVAGAGSFMPSNRAHAKSSVNGPAKFPLFDPVFPLFEPDKPCHGLTAERQIVQSWLDLDDFLPGFATPLKGL